MAETEKEYMDAKEAAEYLGISRGTLYVYVREGKIKQYEQGVPKRVKYKRSELDEAKRIRPKE